MKVLPTKSRLVKAAVEEARKKSGAYFRTMVLPFSLGIITTYFFFTVKMHSQYLTSYPGQTLDTEMGMPSVVTTISKMSGGVDSDHLFDPGKVPTFMKDYFEWHGQQLQKMREDLKIFGENATESGASDAYLANYRFLVMRCAHSKRKKNGTVTRDRCGGLSDRLKAFPLFIWYAAKTDRILFFRWGKDRPAPIETFLSPGSFWNWTFPDELSRKIEKLEESTIVDGNYSRVYYAGNRQQAKMLNAKCHDRNVWMVEGNDYTGGEERYDYHVTAAINERNETHPDRRTSKMIETLQQRDSKYENFYHDLFHATFRPTTGVQAVLDQYFYVPEDTTSLQSRSWLPVPLERNRYAMVQFRALYPGEPFRKSGDEMRLRETSYHAVECAKSRVAKNKEVVTIYVTSDTARVMEAVHDKYHHQTGNPPGGTNTTAAYNVWTNLDLEAYDPNATGGEKDGVAMKTKPAIALAEDPPHLNFATPDDIAAFYVVFVDLFLMSYSNCVVYGSGGFGRLGSLVSYTPSCGTAFSVRNGKKLQQCDPFDS